MRKEEYTDRVLAAMRRVTDAERAAIRAELDAHMEDHMEALLDLGYEPELAEQRTMERMGDPEEVGRELDKQYPIGWLILERVARTILVLLSIAIVLGLFSYYSLWNSVKVRMDPRSEAPAWEERIDLDLDLRMEIGSDVLRIFGSGVERDAEEDRTRVDVLYCWYDQNLLGYVTGGDIDFWNCRSEKIHMGGSGSSRNARVAMHDWQGEVRTEEGFVHWGDPYVTAVVERYGERYEIQVPLNWEEEVV